MTKLTALRVLVLCAVASVAATARADTCSPFGNAPRPMTTDVTQLTCSGGTTMPTWSDPDGNTRTACLYEPASASAASPLPLIVYLHPSLFTADTIPTATNLLDFQNTADVSGDPARPGFIIVAPEGRSTQHFYPSPDDTGTGWDNWYRQIDKRGRDVTAGDTTYPLNVDVATIDHFIDAEVATGKVDTRRIYVTGWSNGAAMGFLYGLNRPGIAAAAVYTGPDPFEAFNDPCPQTPVSRRARTNGEIRLSNKRLPVYHVHNACDIAGICPNGELLLSQLLNIHVRFTDLIIADDETPVTMCDAACGTNPDADVNFADNPEGYTRGSQNHTRWPKSHTQGMLDFFRAHRGHQRYRPISQP
jgi:poly(3-hydroxybutyrate) depolymerase